MYEDWFCLEIKRGRPTEVAAKIAITQVRKHTPLPSSTIPWWVKMIVRLKGGKQMSEHLKKSWSFLDGKKTAIGAVLTFFVLVGPEVHSLAVDLGVTQNGLAVITSGILIVGAVHKVWKMFSNGKE
jgi:hypothetical protein